MARKRLSPAQTDYLAEYRAAATPPSASPNASGRPPIAQMTAEAASSAALREVTGELEAARAEGRMVLSVPLGDIVIDHLARDRVLADGEAMDALKASLRDRGQQTPIEVQALPDGRYGLISGWRRILALQSLLEETGEARFARVLALQRRPVDQQAAYVAMVEENEIRADLSYFERALIVRRAVGTGVFESEKQALQSLFSAASYAKRSKIKSFLALVDRLGDVLRFPAGISERLGLALAKVLGDADAVTAIRAALDTARPDTAEAEAAALLQALARLKGEKEPAQSRGARSGSGAGRTEMGQSDMGQTEAGQSEAGQASEIAPGIQCSTRQGRVVLSGPGVDAALIARLQAWLRGQMPD